MPSPRNNKNMSAKLLAILIVLFTTLCLMSSIIGILIEKIIK